MRWLDPRGQLQEAALTADRDAVDRRTRLRNARAQDRSSGIGGNAAGGQQLASLPRGRAQSTTTPWHEDIRQMLGDQASDRHRAAAQTLNGGKTLDALIQTLDATQRADEAAGRIRQQNIDRTSLNGTEAQIVTEGLLRETRAQLEPGNWISRAIWLCLAPHYTPLLRPALQVRSIDNLPLEVLT
eukprot:4716421-Pyramimonas_sp.AAC.1